MISCFLYDIFLEKTINCAILRKIENPVGSNVLGKPRDCGPAKIKDDV